MPDWITKEQMRSARKCNLYDYLCKYHSDDIEIEGDSIRLYDNRSISIRWDFSGYIDFATDETGNAIDCLTRYFDYDFKDAVLALCKFVNDESQSQDDTMLLPASDTPVADKPQEPAKKQTEPFVLPEPLEGPYRNLFAYLTQTRQIPAGTIEWLIEEKVLYQEREHNNIVFVNPEKSFAEIRGTNSFKPFHKVMFSDPDAFWWFKTKGLNSNPDIAFICEAAIDAISLYCVHRMSPNWKYNALYCSIAGVTNQRRIDCIKAGMDAVGLPTALAVDNDPAGIACVARNPGCERALPLPPLKDWNEVLIYRNSEGTT